MELISIIVPVYNTENYLSLCIDSILNQSYDNFELILIDDGSTDNSLDIINNYAINDSRIKVITKQNGGQSSARNAALKIVKGDFVIFIDSDDWVDKQLLEKVLLKAIDTESDIVLYGHTMDMNDNSVKCSPVHGDYPETFYNRDELLRIFVDSDNIMCNKLFNISLFRDNNITFKEGRTYEDFLICPQLFFNAKKISIINECYYHYVIGRNEATTSSYTFKKFKDVYYNLIEIKEYLLKEELFAKYNNLYNELYKQYTMFFLPNYIYRTTNNLDRKQQLNFYNNTIKSKYTLGSLIDFNSPKININKYNKITAFFLKLFHTNQFLFKRLTYLMYTIKR